MVDKFPDLYRNEEDLVADGLWGANEQLFMKRYLDPHDKDRVTATPITAQLII